MGDATRDCEMPSVVPASAAEQVGRACSILMALFPVQHRDRAVGPCPGRCGRRVTIEGAALAATVLRGDGPPAATKVGACPADSDQ